MIGTKANLEKLKEFNLEILLFFLFRARTIGKFTCRLHAGCNAADLEDTKKSEASSAKQ